MTHKTHIIGGIALAGVVQMTFFQMAGLEITGLEMAGYYGLVALGAVLPDIDHQKSFISTHSWGLQRLFKGCKHRGITHTLLVCLLLQGLQLLIWGKSWVGLGIGIGYLSHLLLDALNPMGVPIAYPLTKKKFHIARIKTGSNKEYMVFGMLVVVVIYCFYHIIV